MENKYTRRRFNRLTLSAAVSASLIPFEPSSLLGLSTHQYKLVHPGMLHSKDDLARMKESVYAHREPIMSGFEVLRQHPNSQSNYIPRGPAAIISRNPTVHVDLFDSDCNAAYQCALMWCITRDQAYARTSIRVLNEWVSTLKEITGADAVLCASLGGFKLINAAEIIRYTDAGWRVKEIQAAEDFFRRVFLPVIHNFAPFANGNWDIAAIKCMMAIGIFCDDVDLVDDALDYYLHGCGDGQLENYIYPGGQCQESGRDQQHTQLGLGHMGDTCEMAWNQGLDLYSAARNRLLEGFEYTAQYNLELEVVFIADHDRTGKYSHQKISPRSSLRPIYEQIFNHYVYRMKVAAPFTQRAAEKVRPEGAANGADHTGFGTLLYSRSANDFALASARIALGSLHATGSKTEIHLTWVPSSRQTTYTINRSGSETNSYQIIAAGIAEPTFTDRKVIANQSYFYRVAPACAEHSTRQVSITAGLPRNWSERSYGDSLPSGRTNVVGNAFTVQAYGTHPFNCPDELHFVYKIFPENSVLTARLSPLLASQIVTAGLMLRTEDTSTAGMIALSISTSSNGERPQWNAALISRDSHDKAVHIAEMSPLDVPRVTYGRIAQPIWLRLTQNSNMVHAHLSQDGVSWIDAGRVSTPKVHLLAGCFACSGLGSVSTQVVFEHVSIHRAVLDFGP
jgi:hypothetical protein